MLESPILHSRPMVIATMNDLKTVTRRIPRFCKKHPEEKWWTQVVDYDYYDDGSYRALVIDDHGTEWTVKSPYGGPRDFLWVKETFSHVAENRWLYRADEPDAEHPLGEKWTPSIYMRKEAARIWLENISVTLVRLGSITQEDAINEGIAFLEDYEGKGPSYLDYYFKGKNPRFVRNPIESYMSLWRSINNRPNEPDSWNPNLWVWRIETKTVSKVGYQ